MRLRRILSVFILTVGISFSCLANPITLQTTVKMTVVAASVIRITPSTPITMNIGPTVAGSTALNNSNSTSYLKITSLNGWNETKKVQVVISSGTVPAGTLLKVKASPCTTGQGGFGAVQPQITLKNTNQTLINTILSCYSGNLATDGYNLTYVWGLDPNNLTNLTSNSTTAAFVTFTISNNW